MLRHEEDLYGALKKDLGKSRMESYMCEIGLTLSELTWMEKHIRRLTREKRVPTPLAQLDVYKRQVLRTPMQGETLIQLRQLQEQHLLHHDHLFFLQIPHILPEKQ